MPAGKDSCPLCGALPCDWVDDPHQRFHDATQIIAALKDFVLLSDATRIFGKDAAEWKHRAILWLLDEGAPADPLP